MRFRFEDYELDAGAKTLSKAGAAIKVEPRIIELLHFLILHRDRVVARDELVQEIWAGCAVSDATINSRISYVRNALNDDGRAQRLIKTVPQKGFQFVGAVTDMAAELAAELAAETAPIEAGQMASVASPKFRPVIVWPAIAAGLALLFAGGVLFVLNASRSNDRDAHQADSVERALMGSAFGPERAPTEGESVADGDGKKAVSGVAETALHETVRDYEPLGWRLVDIEIDQTNGEALYDGTFVKSDHPAAFVGFGLRHEFQEHRRRQMDRNLRIVDFEVSSTGAPVSFAGVWAPGEGEESLTLPRSASAFKALIRRMHRRGYELIDMEFAVSNDALIRYYSVWRTGDRKAVFTQAVPEEDFAVLEKQMQLDGYQPFDVEAGAYKDEKVVAALWRKTKPTVAADRG